MWLLLSLVVDEDGDDDDDAMCEIHSQQDWYLPERSRSVADSIDYTMNHHNVILLFDIDDNQSLILEMMRKIDCVELD